MNDIVYVIRRSFYPPFNGDRVRTASVASALANVHSLHVVDMGRGAYPAVHFPNGHVFDLPYGGQARFYSAVRIDRACLDIWKRLSGKPADPAWLWRSTAQRWRACLRLLERLQPRVLVVDHPQFAPLALASQVPLRIVNTQNLESALTRASAEATGKRRLRRRVVELEKIERELLPRFDQVWGVREEDLAVYRALGVRKTLLAPNVIADSTFQSPARVGEPGRALMFGWLGYDPNAEAARYLVQLGERAAQTARPLRIVLVGRDPEPQLLDQAKQFPWLEVPGFAVSMQAYVDQAAVIAVPLRWGGGTKLKVIEALAFGKPLVTTPVGAEGLELTDGVHALIRELGPSFDAAVSEVAHNPARYQEMASHGREMARKSYSLSALTRIVRGALTS